MLEHVKYIEHIVKSIDNANKGISKISDDIYQIEGMSGIGTRHFYNNIVSLEGARYLEIGTWKGSSVCSAMSNNKATIVCMDNWFEFGGPKEEFYLNFMKHKGENNAQFIEADSFKFDITTFPTKFNIYMYDGCHDDNSHYYALTHYIDALDDIFIYIVDDWNWDHVFKPTMNAIKDLNLKILYQKDIFTTGEPEPRLFNGACDNRYWANGCGIFILKK